MARVLAQKNVLSTKSKPDSTFNLTEREFEVPESVARGERSKEVAAHLGISERTVKARLASIYNKLGVDACAAAIAVAAQNGLLKLLTVILLRQSGIMENMFSVQMVNTLYQKCPTLDDLFSGLM